ncbi:Transposase IS116/IS110/IS902 family protein [Anaerohalosphaera lusitana]|uniref:Transposase IS116/IS110/IS902 family protein n=1 Tax=Anaerohalosphaera lusitana TaxID=1936003 RepID=A0A1U9NJZ6_9BACT|nr:IS110 family transposase [Anaerohalosphaera lusitana]AQT68064.1 Transposase IS116/IS110/IS902 family protein [Anaerohalosphaera lusitana]
METILAIDLGKNKSVFCQMDRASLKTKYRTVRTRPELFHDIFAELNANSSIVLFESGNQAGWLADMLRAMQLPFKVAAWKWTNNPVKSDKKDAKRLAVMYHHGFFPEVHVPVKKVRQKRSLINYRQKLVTRMTQIKNSIRAIMCSMAIDLPAGRNCWTKKHLETISQHASPLKQIDDPCQLWRGQLHAELQQYKIVQQQLDRVTAKLDALGKKDPATILISNAPGIGPRTAEAVSAVIDDPHRFKNARHVSSYVGFTPRRYQSGEMDRTGRISKHGNPLLRMLLVQASWASLQYAWAREIYDRVCRGSAKRRKIAIIAVARHMLIRCWAMLRDNKPWRHDRCKVARV